MCKRNNSNLFYTCSLIEYLSRETKKTHTAIVNLLGKERIEHIYEYADVLHCEPIEKVVSEYIDMAKIKQGDFDNISTCVYNVPTCFDIGKVFERLIEDVSDEDDVIDTLIEVYNSFIVPYIANFNTAFYYSSRDYIYTCYVTGQIL